MVHFYLQDISFKSACNIIAYCLLLIAYCLLLFAICTLIVIVFNNFDPVIVNVTYVFSICEASEL